MAIAINYRSDRNKVIPISGYRRLIGLLRLPVPMKNCAGFATTSLATRLADAQAKLVITADTGMRAGKSVRAVVKGKHHSVSNTLEDLSTENKKNLNL
jgi:acyl-coenzyme A synthetase/AMP-(fatty) acid ligase